MQCYALKNNRDRCKTIKNTISCTFENKNIYLCKRHIGVLNRNNLKLYENEEYEKIIKKVEDLNIIEVCNLCYTNENIGYKLKCKHWFCKECLRDYFKKTSPENILDPINYEPLCPKCKSENIKTHISHKDIEYLIKKNI